MRETIGRWMGWIFDSVKSIESIRFVTRVESEAAQDHLAQSAIVLLRTKADDRGVVTSLRNHTEVENPQGFHSRVNTKRCMCEIDSFNGSLSDLSPELAPPRYLSICSLIAKRFGFRPVEVGSLRVLKPCPEAAHFLPRRGNQIERATCNRWF